MPFRAYCEEYFWIKSGRFVTQSKYVIGAASSSVEILLLFLLACCNYRFVPVRPCRHLKIIFHWVKNVIPLVSSQLCKILVIFL